MDYKIFSDISEIPEDTDVTVVTLSTEFSAINDAVDIQDYRNGEKIGDETYHTVSDVSDEILIRTNKRNVYVHTDAEITFDTICDFAELYRAKNGDLDAISDELDKRMFNMMEILEEEEEEEE